jgi:hypothetical protein
MVDYKEFRQKLFQVEDRLSKMRADQLAHHIENLNRLQIVVQDILIEARYAQKLKERKK